MSRMYDTLLYLNLGMVVSLRVLQHMKKLERIMSVPCGREPRH